MTSSSGPVPPSGSAPSTVLLSGGVRLPMVGLGTAGLLGEECVRAVGWALEHGYRLLDTATAYRNEREVGAAVRDAAVARDDVVLETKLPPEHVGRERRKLEESLAALGVAHVDLWLVHWPPGGEAGVPTWREMVRARDEGLVRALGVSNYTTAQVDTLTRETGVTPSVNQVRWSPLHADAAFLGEMRERGVVVQGYSPLRDGVLDRPLVRRLAKRYGVTPAQVVVRWHVQHGVVVIPRSSRRERIVTNADVDRFTFTEDEMAALDALSGEGR